MVAQFRAALPDAAIVVYDNNSTDGTGEIARGLGVRVVPVPRQGKGHAVRAAFADLGEFDVIVLTDGDGTYPADAAPLLIAPVLAGAADMAVGARQPTPGAGAMTLTRGLGNTLIRAAFWLLIGPGTTDLLSGYRAFNQALSHDGPASLGRLRDRDRAGQRGGRRQTEGGGGPRPLPSTDRRHAEQAASVPRRLADPGHDREPEPAASSSSRCSWRGSFRVSVLAVTVHWGFAAIGGLGLIALWSLLL